MMPTTLEQIARRREWREVLERDYQQLSVRLQTAYERAIPSIRAGIDALNAEIARRAATGEVVSASMVRSLSSYRAVLERIDIELTDFGRVARDVAAQSQQIALPLAVDTAAQLASSQVPDALRQQFNAVFLRPDPVALENLINFADSAAFRERMATFGQSAAQNFADVVLSLTAQGRNSRAIAGALNAWLTLPYAWAENSVRTMQMSAYRLASHATYRANSRVLSGWVWQATLDTRVCMSCLSQHGRRYPLDQTLQDHHRGRCVPLPIVIGTTWADNMQLGETWFRAQSAAMQRQMMGQGMHREWRAGRVDFRDLSHPYQDDVYGTMLRQATLRELTGR